jgi:hypothetical protein
LPEAPFLEEDGVMARTSRYSQEVRERAVRMVFEHGSEYDSEWGLDKCWARVRLHELQPLEDSKGAFVAGFREPTLRFIHGHRLAPALVLVAAPFVEAIGVRRASIALVQHEPILR